MRTRWLALLVVLFVAGSLQPGAADPVDDAVAAVCALLAPVASLDDVDCDADGYTPAQGDCDDGNPAIRPGAHDDPDLAFVDSNCDGIDGDEARAIFVSTGGLDTWPGTRQDPKRTLAAAVAAASSEGKSVYARAGEYDTGSGLLLANAVSIYGGYGASWARSTGQHTIIRGAQDAAFANGVSDVVLQLLTLSAQQGGLHGNAYGLRALSSTLRLERVTVTAGPGRDGGFGGPGAVGGPASSGAHGSNGSCDGNVGLNGGFGGGSPIGAAGGRGGHGSEGNNGGTGAAGVGAPGGASGGAGGPGGTNGSQGSPGLNGMPGQHGAHGAHGQGGANTPLASPDHWVGRSGANGQNGQHGGGGGGGGAGGGQSGPFVNDGAGNGGGGGGAGGEGGLRGIGGAAGGGSFGLYLRSSTVTVADGSTIAAGQGGRGSGASNGNPGQQGGAGGSGAVWCLSEIGRGGNGGPGGNGGNGGSGGGGAGGPSIGAYRDAGSNVSFVDAPQPTHGSGGQGGDSYGGASFRGATGIAAPIYGP